MRGKAGPLPRFSGLFFSDWPVFLQPVAKNSPEKGEQGLPWFPRLPLLPPSQDCFFRPALLPRFSGLFRPAGLFFAAGGTRTAGRAPIGRALRPLKGIRATGGRALRATGPAPTLAGCALPAAKNRAEKGEQGPPRYARLPWLPPSQSCFLRPAAASSLRVTPVTLAPFPSRYQQISHSG